MPQPHNSSRLLAAVSGTEWLFLEFNELEVLAVEDLAEADVWQSPGLYCANNATFCDYEHAVPRSPHSASAQRITNL